ncbi:MAG: YqeB family protein, partial [Rubrobacter sp.]
MQSGASSGSDETIVSESVWALVLTWTGLPLLGAGAGWLLKSVAGWVATLPWAPLQGPFKLADQLIASFGEPQSTIGALAFG